MSDFDNYDNFEDLSSEKPRRRKKPVTKKADNKVVLGVLSIIIAFAVFVVMLVIGKRITVQEAKVACVECIAEVPEGIVLTQENMPMYFAMTERPASQVPAGRYVTSGYEVEGRTLLRKMYPQEILTKDCVSDIYFGNDIYDGIEDPVLISIDAGKIGNSVAGTLKAGDRVDVRLVVKYEDPNASFTGNLDYYDGMKFTDTPDATILTDSDDDQANVDAFVAQNAENLNKINAINEASKFGLIVDDMEAYEGGTWAHSHKFKAYEVLSNVYVESVYTSGGETAQQASANGTPMSATIVNIIIPAAYEDTVTLALEDGEIYLIKVLTEREHSSYDPIELDDNLDLSGINEVPQDIVEPVVEQAPIVVEETPVEETPVEEVPVEEAPAQ